MFGLLVRSDPPAMPVGHDHVRPARSAAAVLLAVVRTAIGLRRAAKATQSADKR
jgi:hypothetical protein